jgi:hypothetical protein
MKFPIIGNSFWMPKMMICQVYDRTTAHNLNNVTDGFKRMSQMLHTLCHEYNGNIVRLADSVNDVYRNIANEVRDTQFIRSRRAILPFVGEILKELFGSAIDKDTNKLNKKMEAIQHLILSQHNSTKILEKEFLGITRLVDTRTRQVNKALMALGTHLSKIDSQINVIWDHINDNFDGSALTFCLNMIEALNSAISSVYNVTLLSSVYNSWEHALLQLREGVLPLNVIPFTELKPILDKVEASVRPNYELAIDHDSWAEYYLIPLATVSITSEDIFIRLTIPLKRADSPVSYNILSPITSPIPCTHTACSFNERIANTSKYFTFNIKSTSWIADHSNTRILGEVNLFDLNCIPIGVSQLCYSFESAIIAYPSMCTKALWNWNEAQILNNCHFELTPTAIYRPIKVMDNAFVLHKDELKHYDMICPGKSSGRQVLKTWAELVIIENGCYLIATGIMLQGPVTGHTSSFINARSPKFVFDSISYVNLINTSRKSIPGRPYFNLTKFETSIQMDSQ